MSDPLKPGEMSLEDDAAPAPVVEETPPPVVETPPEEIPPPEDVPAEEQPRHRGAVGELMERRRENKELRERIQALEGDPAVRRVLSDAEIRRGLVEGRVVVAPQKTQAEAQREALTDVANQLGLVRPDGAPDLEAAERVARFVDSRANAAVAPVRQQAAQAQTAHAVGLAEANVRTAVEHATKAGYPAAVVQHIENRYRAEMGDPQRAALLSQPEIATQLWHVALGEAVSRGLMVPGAPAKPAVPEPIVTESGGRRAAASAIQFSPGIRAVYKNNGLDPAATALPQPDHRGSYALED